MAPGALHTGAMREWRNPFFDYNSFTGFDPMETKPMQSRAKWRRDEALQRQRKFDQRTLNKNCS